MSSGEKQARSVLWLDGAVLDFKLGARMLVKYPGITLLAERIYTITSAGRKRLNQETETWEAFVLSMRRILRADR